MEENEIEKRGEFKYFTKNCFCCEKMIILHFILTKDKLLFYKDPNKKKLFLEIPREEVIAINKRQIDKHDVFKFSIYYQRPNEENIHELKLKTKSRGETDLWIRDLRRIINPKRYEFKYDKEKYIDANELYHFRDTKKFYLALCHLEYILLRNRMMDFFEFYRNKIINNKANDSMLFHDENDNEKLNKESEGNIDINDIQPKIN